MQECEAEIWSGKPEWSLVFLWFWLPLYLLMVGGLGLLYWLAPAREGSIVIAAVTVITLLFALGFLAIQLVGSAGAPGIA